MTKRYKVDFNAKVVPIKPLNDEFTLCKCYVMALNKNRNLSFISKETSDAALPTLFNIPVIGHLYVDDEGQYHMGGHDMTIAVNGDGQYEFKSLCVPYGVVPQQDDIHYEDIQEPNGDIHTYLVADVILWTGRFPELNEAIFDEKTYFGQSMEINVLNYAPLEEDKNYTNILEYSYSALCLLGKSNDSEFHKEPCFPMARVDAYEFSAEDEKFVELMGQLKSELAFCFGDNGKKGGESMDESEIVTTANTEVPENFEEVPTTDTDDTSIGVEAEKTLDAEDSEYSKASGTGIASEGKEFEKEITVDNTDTQPQTFSSTYMEKRNAIEAALPYIRNHDESGALTYAMDYWLCDFDEAYAFVEKEEYGSSLKDYHVTKGRFAYSFDEEEKKAVIVGEFEKVFVRWLTQDEIVQLDAQKAHYEELLAYKDEKIRAEHEAEMDVVINEFTDLKELEEFKEVVKNKSNYENAEAIRNICYMIRGKNSKPAVQDKVAGKEISVPVANTRVEPTIYEQFMSRYGKK